MARHCMLYGRWKSFPVFCRLANPPLASVSSATNFATRARQISSASGASGGGNREQWQLWPGLVAAGALVGYAFGRQQARGPEISEEQMQALAQWKQALAEHRASTLTSRELNLAPCSLRSADMKSATLQAVPTSLSAEAADVAAKDELEPLPGPASPPPSPAASPYLTRDFLAEAAARVSPAVVNITVTLGHRGMFFGQSTGSGFIFKEDGTILTNAHVVADATGRNHGKLQVILQDGRNFEGHVIGVDTLTDLAVVKIQSSAPLPKAELGASSKLRAGDWVVALGSPLHLQGTVTAGIISATDRKSSELGLRGARTDFLQTDAAINQGNSGGPLCNMDGAVVGINAMKALAAEGVNFAVPIDTARRVVEHLAKYGRVIRPFLGIKMLELNRAILSQLKERDPKFADVNGGVLVPQVIPGSPAARAGFAPGDVIIEFEGQPITSVKQIMDILDDKVGHTFEVKVARRGNKTATLRVVAEEALPTPID